MEIVCFHNPDEENGYLSNWYPSMFTSEDICFSSMEQYMMYKKAMMFGDTTIAKRIMAAYDVAEIKNWQDEGLPVTTNIGFASSGGNTGGNTGGTEEKVTLIERLRLLLAGNTNNESHYINSQIIWHPMAQTTE